MRTNPGHVDSLERPRSRANAWCTGLLSAAIAVLCLAASLYRIQSLGGELPAGIDWVAHLRERLVPIGERGVNAAWWWAAAGSGGSVWTALVDFVLVRVNGQWDPDLWRVAAAMLQAAAAGVACAAVAREGPIRERLAGAACVGGVFILQAVSFVSRDEQATGAFVLGFAMLQLLLGRGARALSLRWWLGWLAGWCTLVAAPGGLACGVVLFVRGMWGPSAAHERNSAGDRARVRTAWILQGAVLVAAAAYWLWVGRLLPGEGAGSWAAWFGGEDAFHAGLVIAGVAVFREQIPAAGGRARWLAVLGTLAVVLGVGGAANRCIAAGKLRAIGPVIHTAEAVRAWIHEGRIEPLDRIVTSDTTLAHVAGTLKDVRLRAWLPAMLRDPIGLEPEPADASGGFTVAGLPEVGGAFRPVNARGNFAAGGAREAVFESGWVRTPYPFLVLWVTGTVVPPASNIALVTEDGRVVPPLQPAIHAPERWQRLNFKVPAEPFRLIARASASSLPFAFSDPVELGWLSRAAVKLLGLARPMVPFGIGAVLVAAGACGWIWSRSIPWRARGCPNGAWLRRVLPWVLIAGYVLTLSVHMDVAAGGSDSSGYRNSAGLLGQGDLTAAVPRAPELEASALPDGAFVPLGFRVADGGRMVPTYPVGLPLLFAAGELFLPGDMAVGLIGLVHLLVGLWAMRAVARAAGLDEAWSWFAAAVLACNPLYAFMGLQPMSDVPALVWGTVAVWAAMRSRDRPRFAWLAGAATAMAVLIRPTNVLIAMPVVFAIGLRWRVLAAWVAGGIPGAAWQAFYAWRLYGSPLASGYGNLADAFGWHWVGVTLASYLRWWPVLLTWAVWLMVLFPFLREVPRWQRAVFTSWVLGYGGLYAAYFCTHETWWYQRFLLPAMPALVVMGLHAARALGRWAARVWDGAAWRSGAAHVAGALTLGALVSHAIQLRTLYFVGDGHAHERSSRWLRDRSGDRSLVLAGLTSGAVYFYTDHYLLRPDGLDRTTVARAIETAERAGRSVHASLAAAEATALGIPDGAWTANITYGDVTVWTYRGGARASTDPGESPVEN